MDVKDINIDTPVADILQSAGVNQKGYMSRLAMTVFNRFHGNTIKAFTQFAPPDLAAVIEAKRKGVFDYGICIRDTDAGVTWPSDPKSVLSAIDLAADGKADQIDFASLGLKDANGNPSVPVSSLCPASGQKTKTEKAAAKDNVVQFNKPAETPVDPPKEVPPLEDVKTEPEKKTRKKKQADLPQPPLESHDVKDSEATPYLTAFTAQIDKLRTDLADAFETVINKVKETDQKRASVIEDELGYVKNEVENVKAGIIGLYGCVEVLDRNMRQVLLFTFGDAVVFEDLPQGAESMLKCAVPDDLAERVEKVEKENPTPAPNAERQAANSPAQGEAIDIFTKAQLGEMDLNALREYGARLGIEPAKWATTQINRIVEEYERRGIKIE